MPTSDAARIVRELHGAGGCPTDWSDELSLYDGVNPGCTTCSCGAPTGGHCELTVRAYDTAANDPNCTSPLNTATSPDGACVNVTGEAWGVSNASPVGGSCQDSGGNPKPLSSLRVCKLTADAQDLCGAGHLCAPKADAQLGSACVLISSADAACPDDHVAVDGASYQQVTDTRACSCSCGPVEESECTSVGGIDIYSGTSCQTFKRGVPAGDGCAQLNTAGTQSYRVKAGTWGASGCTAFPSSGGQLSFAGDTTLCCPP